MENDKKRRNIHTISVCLVSLLLTATACTTKQDGTAVDALLAEGEQYIKEGCLNKAHDIVLRGQSEAKDSDTYYRFALLDAKRHFYATHSDSFLLCNKQLESYLSRHYSPEFEIERLMQLGVYNAKMLGNMTDAIDYYREALNVIETTPGQSDNHLRAYINLADGYKHAGKYDKSVHCYRRALELSDSIGNDANTRITICCGIASAYAAMGAFRQSKPWWDEADSLRPQMDRQQLFHYLNNRGNDYYLQHDYESSLSCFLQLDSILKDDCDMKWERMYGWANLSDIYIKLGQKEKALELIEQTEPFFRKEGLTVAVYYLNTQRIELALLNGNMSEAHRLADSDGLPTDMLPDQLRLRLRVLARLYEAEGSWLKYSQTVDWLRYLEDSIAGDQMQMLFTSTLMEYEHEKEMLDKQRELDQHRLSLQLLLAMLVAALLMVVLLIVVLVQRRRTRRLREDAQRSRILALRMETVRNRITPHFIGNALQAELMAQQEGQSPDLNALVQLLHRGIEMSATELTTLADELSFIRFYCNVEQHSVGPDFRLVIDIAPEVEAEKVIMPSMLIQILVENAIKHGLKGLPQREGHYREIIIRASRTGDATLVEVIDNGRGIKALPKPTDKSSSHIGLSVMRKTVDLLNEQNTRRNPATQPMKYALEPYNHPDGSTGCRAWVVLPHDFEYSMKK